MGAAAWRSVAFAVGVLIAWPRTPDPLPADAPSELFSAARAFAHIARWSEDPRPSGSPAHAAVVDDVARELAVLGLNARIVEYGPLRNIEAHGGEGEGGVWLVAHSDSVPAAPGAGDDGLGLGVLVEAARALSMVQPPTSLHVLVTDGEERGLFGAQAHADSASDAPRVMLNVEARGTSGPAFMFQTSGPTAPLVERFRASGCTAQASSLAHSVYAMLPNDTDFSVFRAKGWSGYDFAIIGGAWRYHTPEDSAANLDLGSVQHVGDCVLALARAWLDREVPASGPASALSYAPLLGNTLAGPAWIVQVAGVLLLLGSVVFGRFGGRAGVVATLLTSPLLVAAGLLISPLPFVLSPAAWHGPAEVRHPEPYVVLAYGLGLALPWALVALARRASGQEADESFTSLVPAVAGIAAIAWPAGGYLLVPAGLCCLFALAGRPGWAFASAVLAGLVVGPVLVTLPVALTTRMLPVLCVVPFFLAGFLVARWPRRA